jgi:RNA polymerase sigma factor for flagellar operon FliA
MLSSARLTRCATGVSKRGSRFDQDARRALGEPEAHELEAHELETHEPEAKEEDCRLAAGTGPRQMGSGKAQRCALSTAQEALLLEHVGVVRQVARGMHERLPRHVELEELVSAGMLGLVDAAARYCPDRNVQFRSYAQFRVRGAILDSLRSLDWGPRALRRKGRALQQTTQMLQGRLGRCPSEAEVAQAMGIALEELQQLSGDLRTLEVSTLHAPRGEDSGEQELEFLPARDDENPLTQLLAGESREKLLGALERLAERERLVMSLYYFEELTMKQIGLTLGLVESRISQIHQAALQRLRSLLGDLRPRAMRRLRAG